MTKPTKKSKSIDEVLTSYRLKCLAVFMWKGMIPEKKAKEYSNIAEQQIQRLIDEAVEKERKRILDKKKLMSVMKNIVLGNTLNIINASFIADAIIKESGGEDDKQ